MRAVCPPNPSRIASGLSFSITSVTNSRVDGEEVDLVRHPLVGLDGRDVGVDEDRADPLLPEGLEALATGVVELAAAYSAAFACFSDFYCPAAQDQRTLHAFMFRTLSPTVLFFLEPGSSPRTCRRRTQCHTAPAPPRGGTGRRSQACFRGPGPPRSCRRR